MTFEDATMIRLATPAARAALFDDTALQQFLDALYDTDFVSVQAPFQPVFDELQLGVPVPRAGSLEGEWGLLGSSERTAVNIRIGGTAGDPLQLDAFWRGFIIAGTTHPTGTISSVTTALPDPGAIDTAIVQALGALPAGAALETERRNRLTAALKAAAGNPDVVSGAEVDRLLSQLGAASVNDYFDRVSREAALEAVKVTLVEPAPPAVSPKALPVAAAILVRDDKFSVRQLLADSRAVRDQLQGRVLGRAQDGLRRRQDLLVVWIVPASVFDDTAWPGGAAGMDAAALRQARRSAAGQWLAAEGIGLAAVS